MAEFFGRLQGDGMKSVTRTGTKRSGIDATVQHDDGSVGARIWKRESDGVLMVELSVDNHSTGTPRRTFRHMPLPQLLAEVETATEEQKYGPKREGGN